VCDEVLPKRKEEEEEGERQASSGALFAAVPEGKECLLEKESLLPVGNPASSLSSLEREQEPEGGQPASAHRILSAPELLEKSELFFAPSCSLPPAEIPAVVPVHEGMAAEEIPSDPSQNLAPENLAPEEDLLAAVPTPREEEPRLGKDNTPPSLSHDEIAAVPSPLSGTAPPPRQEVLQFEPVTRGRFEKSEPTIFEGKDIDVPTFLRLKIKLK
jgi:hypothetical protein